MAGVPRPTAPPVADITDASDVDLLVRRFYQAAIPDPLLGPLFETAGIDWSVHIPVLRAFWERELLGLPGYAANVVRAHRAALGAAPFGRINLERWVELFDETVDELFVGPVAEHAKQRSAEIASALASLAARPTQGAQP
jgi:hemoglobin